MAFIDTCSRSQVTQFMIRAMDHLERIGIMSLIHQSITMTS